MIHAPLRQLSVLLLSLSLVACGGPTPQPAPTPVPPPPSTPTPPPTPVPTPGEVKLTQTYAAPGTSLTLMGLGFGETRGNATVHIGDTTVVDVVSWADDRIVLTIPALAHTGQVRIERSGAVWESRTAIQILQALTLVSGDGQTDLARARLPHPMVVRVVNTEQQPVADVPVSFTTTAGTLMPGALTNDEGLISATLVLGDGTPAVHEVVASVPGLPTVSFRATALPYLRIQDAGPANIRQSPTAIFRDRQVMIGSNPCSSYGLENCTLRMASFAEDGTPGSVSEIQLRGTANRYAVAPDGSVLLVGFSIGVLPDSQFTGDPNEFSNVMIARLNPSGALAWVRTLNGGSSIGGDEAYGAAFDAAGNAYVVGNTSGDLEEPWRGRDPTNPRTAQPMFIMKYAPDGTRVWVRQFATDRPVGNRAFRVLVARDGGIIVAGHAEGQFSPESGALQPLDSNINQDLYLARFEPNGTRTWARRAALNTSLIDVPEDLVEGPDGELYVASFTDDNGAPSVDPPSAQITRFAPDGTLVWHRRVPLPEDARTMFARAHALAVGQDELTVVGDYEVQATTTSSPKAAFLARLTPDGTFKSTQGMGKTALASAFGVGYAANGNVLVTGTSNQSMPGLETVQDSHLFIAEIPSP